jgi:hypothetical protein
MAGKRYKVVTHAPPDGWGYGGGNTPVVTETDDLATALEDLMDSVKSGYKVTFKAKRSETE